MPAPMPPLGFAAPLFFSGICVMTPSVVSSNDATDTACCRADPADVLFVFVDAQNNDAVV